MVIKMVQWGNILSTRDLGNEIRDIITENINKTDEIINLDFTNVEGITQSCADEVFGKLVKNIELKTLRERIKFSNMNDKITSVIKYVMASNLKK